MKMFSDCSGEYVRAIKVVLQDTVMMIFMRQQSNKLLKDLIKDNIHIIDSIWLIGCVEKVMNIRGEEE